MFHQYHSLTQREASVVLNTLFLNLPYLSVGHLLDLPEYFWMNWQRAVHRLYRIFFGLVKPRTVLNLNGSRRKAFLSTFPFKLAKNTFCLCSIVPQDSLSHGTCQSIVADTSMIVLAFSLHTLSWQNMINGHNYCIVLGWQKSPKETFETVFHKWGKQEIPSGSSVALVWLSKVPSVPIHTLL